jgi:hypothetical protein
MYVLHTGFGYGETETGHAIGSVEWPFATHFSEKRLRNALVQLLRDVTRLPDVLLIGSASGSANDGSGAVLDYLAPYTYTATEAARLTDPMVPRSASQTSRFGTAPARAPRAGDTPQDALLKSGRVGYEGASKNLLHAHSDRATRRARRSDSFHAFNHLPPVDGPACPSPAVPLRPTVINDVCALAWDRMRGVCWFAEVANSILSGAVLYLRCFEPTANRVTTIAALGGSGGDDNGSLTCQKLSSWTPRYESAAVLALDAREQYLYVALTGQH